MPRNGVYQIVGTINGERVRESTQTTDVAKASAYLLKREQEILNGQQRLKEELKAKLTVGEYFSSYIESHSLAKKDTHRDASATQSFVATHGRRPLEDFLTDPDLCQRYIESRRREVSEHTGRLLEPGTVVQEVKIIKAIFQRAIDTGKIVGKNPWQSARPGRAGVRLPKPPKRSRVLKPEEQPKFFAALKAIGDEWEDLGIALTGSGLRNQEMRMLRPSDVIQGDGRPGRIMVREETAKGHKARQVPLLPEVAEAFARQMARRELTETSTRVYFPFDERLIQRMWEQAYRACDIPRLIPHDMRRTFGTRCARAGVMPKALQRMMGHSDIKITMEFYVALEDDEIATMMSGIRIL